MRAVLVAALVALAGCVVEQESSPRTISASADGDGLAMNATVTSEDGRHGLSAVVRNVGRETYNISSICAPVYSHHIERAGDHVWPEPEVMCMAYGVKPFAPGSSESLDASWDESLSEGGGKAEPGDYLWVVTFHYKEEEAGPWLELSVDVPFQVR